MKHEEKREYLLLNGWKPSIGDYGHEVWRPHIGNIALSLDHAYEMEMNAGVYDAFEKQTFEKHLRSMDRIAGNEKARERYETTGERLGVSPNF